MIRAESEWFARQTFDKRHVYATCLNRRDTESYCRAACVLELLMVNGDILDIPGNFEQ